MEQIASRRGRSDCVSGSPKRQLYSSTRGRPRSASSRREHAEKRHSRRLSSWSTGVQTSSTSSATSASSRPGTASTSPSRRCWRPRRCRRSACSPGRRAAAAPAIRRTARRSRPSSPSRSSSTWKGWRERLRCEQACIELRSGSADPDTFPAARPSAFTTTAAARRPRSRRRIRPPPSRPGERLRPLDLRRLGAGAEDGNAAVTQLVASPLTRGASGPTTNEVDTELPASGTSEARSSARTGWQLAARRFRASRRRVQLTEAPTACERPDERMLPTPRPTTSTFTRRSYGCLRRRRPRSHDSGEPET